MFLWTSVGGDVQAEEEPDVNIAARWRARAPKNPISVASDHRVAPMRALGGKRGRRVRTDDTHCLSVRIGSIFWAVHVVLLGSIF